MSYRIKEIMEKLKKKLPLYIVLWVFLVVVMIGCAYSYQTSMITTGSFELSNFFTYFEDFSSNPLQVIGKSFSGDYAGTTFNWIMWTTIIFVLVLTIGTIRNAKNMEYRDIEHGSSDWSKGGEQYKILSNKKGIILAENNYLPLEKRGNVNVLIVGRFWCW